MLAELLELLAWTATAFVLWLFLGALLGHFRVPGRTVVAAVLGWILAGLLVVWALPAAPG